MSAVPQVRTTRVRRRGHGGALLAAIAYGLAAFAVYQLVVPSLRHHGEPAAGVDSAAAASPATTDLATSAPREVLALRAVASRVQQSVYTIRAGGSTRGSGFVAWIYGAKISFLLTARTAVASAEEDGLSVRRGAQSLPARVVRSDPASGLAVLRVNAALDRPLWQQAGARAPLRRGATAIAVAAGKTGAFEQAELVKTAHAFTLSGVGGRRYLGAPVLVADGRLTGIVVDVSTGDGRLVSLADACRRVRHCR